MKANLPRGVDNNRISFTFVPLCMVCVSCRIHTLTMHVHAYIYGFVAMVQTIVTRMICKLDAYIYGFVAMVQTMVTRMICKLDR